MSPRIHPVFRKPLLLLVVGTLILPACQSSSVQESLSASSSNSSGSLDTSSAGSSGSSSGSSEVRITITASKQSYDKRTITVPAGALVTIQFINNDNPALFHNFAVYQNRDANTPIFRGQLVGGGTSTTYQFVAPSTPGTYHFQCDPHHGSMEGNFIVTPR
ncbi:MAG: cupredoxin domain-containing protein [Chloroflexi bacterium]|nr:cupredoxin domain-containing protein [Chloroflexota bacterium]